MAEDDQTWACNFEIHGKKIPPEMLDKFMQATALLTGVKGHIEKAKDGVYKGRLEGKKVVIEKFKGLLEKAEEFKGVVEQTVFETMKQIKETEVTVFDGQRQLMNYNDCLNRANHVPLEIMSVAKKRTPFTQACQLVVSHLIQFLMFMYKKGGVWC